MLLTRVLVVALKRWINCICCKTLVEGWEEVQEWRGFTFTRSLYHDHFYGVVWNMLAWVEWQWMRFHIKCAVRARCIVPVIVWSPHLNFVPGRGLSLLIGFDWARCSVSRGRCLLPCIAGGNCTHYCNRNRFVERIHLLDQKQNGPHWWTPRFLQRVPVLVA